MSQGLMAVMTGIIGEIAVLVIGTIGAGIGEMAESIWSE
jgi:hypothetical protein